MDLIKETFHRYELDIRRISRICSIDLKAEEEGILAAAKALQAEYITFSAEVLKKVPGEFAASDFVRQTVGVDNVCERSAALGSNYGSKRIPKVSGSGVTLSAYEMDYTVAFRQTGAKH
jgi:cobalt-precorrin 5A hydrolase